VLVEEVGRVLMEISVTEQRYQAVLAVLGGVPVTEVAGRFGVGRQSVHRWLARYEQGGRAGLDPLPSRSGSTGRWCAAA
jgi:transposase